ncbi:LemA family protein [Faecalicatena sp. AGMB00832]|uniref:LemA family protein n=1 Tax=Faecalicatena faecalis TaxID=2726362 RepID=A0ABS6D0U2_9FIRM|nr:MULTISPECIES: LemA family protein [Faecalicatena]MBU3875203.1 LemA family protein [Faecalicatena faecalis]MCI6467832.1 LemA family protein [Faecalicatena sp.]MDY5619526.1 LemA family protein [Lachnospiraceae bacterium]
MNFIQRQHSVVKFLIYLVMIFVGGFILSVIIGVMESRGGEMDDWAFTVAYAIAIVATFVLAVVTEHNGLFALKERALAMRKDISIVQAKTENVLFQLEGLMMTHMEHEKQMYIQKDFSYENNEEGKGKKKKIRTIGEVRNSIRQYPELRSDDDVMRLFNEIIKCQNELMTQKTSYNSVASQYNAGIQKALAKRMKRLWHLERLEYYDESPDILVEEEIES